MTDAPLVQLYCKRLDETNLDAFLRASPDHVGWQINAAKLHGRELEEAVARSRRVSRRLSEAGIVSVFLIHPSTDHSIMAPILDEVRPDIFLASAERSADVLATLASTTAGLRVMVPVGVPQAGGSDPSYDPLAEMRSFESVADWFTTDTITARDDVRRFGCSGETSEWNVMAPLIAAAKRPVVAAGGLTPTNVQDLWRLCRPAGFDAHTAVCTDGLPDEEKSAAFCRAVRSLPT